MAEQEETRQGKIKFFNAKKEFGFVIDNKTGRELYVHADDLVDFVVKEDEVTFKVAKTEKGLVAVEVRQYFGD